MKFCTTCFMYAAILFLAIAPRVTTAAADDPVWTPLFNGRDLSGWKTFVDPGSTVPASQIWSVKDQTIICKGRPHGYIITENDYTSYVLRLKWRWVPEDKGGRNSGVLFHITGPDKIWPRSAEAQLMADHTGDFWLPDGFKLTVDPSRKDPANANHYFRMKDNVEKPLGEWNQYEITCDADSIRLVVNGHFVNEGKQPEQNRGRILLQSEGAEIHFRDIVISQ